MTETLMFDYKKWQSIKIPLPGRIKQATLMVTVMPVDESFDKEKKWDKFRKVMEKNRINLKNFKFNREEANER